MSWGKCDNDSENVCLLFVQMPSTSCHWTVSTTITGWYKHHSPPKKKCTTRLWRNGTFTVRCDLVHSLGNTRPIRRWAPSITCTPRPLETTPSCAPMPHWRRDPRGRTISSGFSIRCGAADGHVKYGSRCIKTFSVTFLFFILRLFSFWLNWRVTNHTHSQITQWARLRLFQATPTF